MLNKFPSLIFHTLTLTDLLKLTGYVMYQQV